MAPVDGFVVARDALIARRADYEAAYRGFAWPAVERFNWALDYFDPMARGNERAALRIVDEAGREERRTFADLADRSDRIANFFRRRGVRRGDRILVMLGNAAPLWEVMLAAMKVGAVVSPATTMLTAADVKDRITRGRLTHAVAESQVVEKLHEVSGLHVRLAVGAPAPVGWEPFENALAAPARFVPEGETRAGDPLLLYFTSGTTASPKMVVHTHQSYPIGHLSTMYWLGLKQGDLHWNISSPGWAKHAWSCFFAPCNAGATVFVYNLARFDARRVLEAAARYEITSLCAPPTVWRLLVLERLGACPPALRELASAGEPLNPEVIERVREAWGITIRDGYGQTETTAVLGNTPGQAVKPGSVGRPLPGYVVTLTDPDGREAAEGRISISLRPRPTGLMAGYADAPAGAAGAERYDTGDVASRDEDGYYWYIGRADDVFKSSDYRISPFEIESALIEHEVVAEAAVVPSPDPIRSAVPKAYVALAPGQPATRETALAIFRFSRERLAPYKRVRRLEFSDLPKTISGKIRRGELRDKERERRLRAERGVLEFWEEEFPEL